MGPIQSRRGRLGRAAGLLWAARDRATLAWLAGAAAAVGLAGVAAVLAPLALARLADLLAGPAPTPGRAAALVGAYAGALLFQRLCEQAQAYAYGRGEQRLSRRLASETFEHMLRLPMAFHLDARSGALAQVLADGAQGLRLILFHLVMTFAPAVLQLVLAGLVVARLFDPATGLILTGALAAYAAVFARGVARQDGPARGIAAAQSEAGGLTADGLMNVEAIKTFTAEGRFAAGYDRVLAAREGQWRLFLTRRLGNGALAALVFAATLGLTLWLAARGAGRGEVSVGGFVLLNAYVLQLVRPLELLGFAARDLGQGLAYLDKLLAIAQEPREAPGPAAAANDVAATGPAELAFDAVSFGFAPGAPTLNRVSFRAPPGATIGVVGPSGAGKSSLLKLILRLHTPQAGEIRLDGRPIGELSLEALRGQIAVVAQDTILLNDTIAENLRLAAAEAGPEALAQAVAAANLAPLISRLPQGLDTPVGERGLKLSGGEKQRVAIARAALRRARLVMFDEATAALDATTEQAVWRALDELSQGATRLIVTHRLAAVTGADEILVLDHGAIVERGRHLDLLAAGGTYARLWAAQKGADDTPRPVP